MPHSSTTDTIRRLLLALLTFGILATTTDLMLLDHHEDLRQYVPLVLNGLALAAILWHAFTASAASVRAIQILMVLFVFAAVLGVTFHFQGNLEFQLDINPKQSSWDLFKKAMQAKAPPALAPGAMAQLGLLGLIYTYRHPAVTPGPAVGPHSTGEDA